MRILLLAAAGCALLVVAVGGIGRNLVYYWGPSELRAAGARAQGASIRLGGQVVPQSIVSAPGGSPLEFDISDGKVTVHVRTTSVPPQMFREGIGVVVEGTLAPAGHFECRRLLVSHGNEYRAPGERTGVDTRRLMQTTIGLDEDGRR